MCGASGATQMSPACGSHPPSSGVFGTRCNFHSPRLVWRISTFHAGLCSGFYEVMIVKCSEVSGTQ